MPRFHLSFVLLTWCLIALTAATSAPAAAEEQQGMFLIPTARRTVGTSESERFKLARRFDCHPTWLNDDLPRHEATLAAYWIDRSPVTNAEWFADQVPHHGVSFQMLKGASWFHEDPLNFRTASGWYASEGWRSAFSGFRCALAGNQKPPGVRQSIPEAGVFDRRSHFATQEGQPCGANHAQCDGWLVAAPLDPLPRLRPSKCGFVKIGRAHV